MTTSTPTVHLLTDLTRTPLTAACGAPPTDHDHDVRLPWWYPPTCPACVAADPERSVPCRFFRLDPGRQVTESVRALRWAVYVRWTGAGRTIRATRRPGTGA